MNFLTLTKSVEEMKNITMDMLVNKRNKVIEPEVIISALINHDSGAKDSNVSIEDYVKHSNGISRLLEAVEKYFDTDYMIKIYHIASRRAGHSIGPIDLKVLQTFVKNGFTPKITKCLQIQ